MLSNDFQFKEIASYAGSNPASRMIKMKIKVITPHGELKAEIDEAKNPKTAQAVISALPITGEASRWGDEIYFEIGAKAGEENSRQEVEVGDIAYWPPGHALCIFFGRTPVSTSDRPRAYSPVNVFGKIIGSMADAIKILKSVKDGERVRIEKA